jgi:hypothetical protein
MYRIEGYGEERLEDALRLASVLAERRKKRVHVMTEPEFWTAPYSVAVFDEQGNRSTIQS